MSTSATRFLLPLIIVSAAGCGAGPGEENAAVEVRHQVDAARNRVWLLTRDGVFVYDKAAPDRIARVPLPNRLRAGEPYGCLPGLALGPKGEAVVSSGVLPTLWRVDPQTLAASAHGLALDADAGREVGFTALAWSAEHGAFFAASASHGSLWRIDPLLAQAQKVELSAPIAGACGLSLRPRAGRPKKHLPPGLCARAARAGWTIALTPDQRFGYVNAQPCSAN